MRFLVTGANGLIGSRLCTLLAGRGHTVFATARSTRPGPPGFEVLPVDLSSDEDARALTRSARPEVIVHTASLADVDACEREPTEAWRCNVRATEAVARAARAAGAHLVHVSTDYVFDGEAGPYGEEDTPNPRGVYAITKHASEQAVRVLAGSWSVARTAVVYGWPPAARLNFGAWLVTALARGEPVRLFQDQQVSPSLANSVAAMLAELGERRLPGVWHTCGGEVLDRVTFGRTLCEVFGFDTELVRPVRMSEVPLLGPRPARSGLRADKVRTQLAAKPLSVREALSAFRDEVRAAQERRS